MSELKNPYAALLGKGGKEEFSFELKADDECAKILMTIVSADDLEGAERIIKGFGIQILEKKSIAPDKVLFRLNAMNMREVVLKLTENGFSGLKGINARAFRKR